MLPTWAKPPRVRQSTMLMRGVDTYGNFDDEPRPDAEWTRDRARELVRDRRRRAPSLIFADSKIAPSEAYGGTRAATSQDAEKGPSASLAASAAVPREARDYRTEAPLSSAGPRHGPRTAPCESYASRAAVGRRLASGPFSLTSCESSRILLGGEAGSSHR